ncbi:MAG: hypothetical protein JWP27_2091 [Flaviaesturariibacter sp.]|nr:hypothetical protein [Flaviaesturariibacter sp.]
MNSRTPTRQSLPLILLFVAVKMTLSPLLVSPLYDLHRDEYLHLDQARHLAAGYLSVPPLTSWVALAIQALGSSDAWVRFFPALLGAATIAVAMLLVRELGGRLFALALTGTALTFSGLLRLNLLFQPNSFDVLAWTALFYLAVGYVRTGRSPWLYAAAVAAALAFLNKYNIVFLLAALVPFLLGARPSLLRNRHAWLAAALFFALIAPNLYWQYINGFPVFHHMQELSDTQLANNSRGQFFLEQVLFFPGSFYLLPIALTGLWRSAPLRPYRFLAFVFLCVLCLFAALRAKGYYAVGLHPAFIAIGSVHLEGLLRNRSYGRWLRPALIVLVIAIFLPPIKALFPVLAPQEAAQRSASFRSLGLLRWEDGRDHTLPQDFADMLGWRELARKTVAVYDSLPDKNTTIILCDNYGEAGAINHYGRRQSVTAVSFNADYARWFPDLSRISTVIRVKEESDPVSAEERRLFARIDTVAIVMDPYARETGTRVYVMTEPRVDIARLLRERVDAAAKEWQK